MMDTPERIWVQWPNVGGCGLAFKTPANPRHKSDDRFNKRTAYILRVRQLAIGIANRRR